MFGFAQHSKNTIHRDLKAENIYLTSAHVVKVGDFGFGTSAGAAQTLNTFCGSPPYAAPELFKDESYYGVYVDVWAFGVLLYFMVTGLMPFRADTVAKLKQQILSGTYEMPEFVSNGCASLIEKILKQMPSDRPNMSQIRHSGWLDGQDFPRAFDEERPPEAEVLHAMRHMGIADEVTRRCRNDLRNAICGTVPYRTLLYCTALFRTVLSTALFTRFHRHLPGHRASGHEVQPKGLDAAGAQRTGRRLLERVREAQPQRLGPGARRQQLLERLGLRLGARAPRRRQRECRRGGRVLRVPRERPLPPHPAARLAHGERSLAAQRRRHASRRNQRHARRQRVLVLRASLTVQFTH